MKGALRWFNRKMLLSGSNAVTQIEKVRHMRCPGWMVLRIIRKVLVCRGRMHRFRTLLHLFNAFIQDNLGKPAPERQTILDFADTRDDRVAVASAGPYANHLHLTADR